MQKGKERKLVTSNEKKKTEQSKKKDTQSKSAPAPTNKKLQFKSQRRQFVCPVRYITFQKSVVHLPPLLQTYDGAGISNHRIAIWSASTEERTVLVIHDGSIAIAHLAHRVASSTTGVRERRTINSSPTAGSGSGSGSPSPINLHAHPPNSFLTKTWHEVPRVCEICRKKRLLGWTSP